MAPKEKKDYFMKQIKYIAFGLIFGIAGFLIGIGSFNDRAFENTDSFVKEVSQEQEQFYVSIMIDTGDDLLGFSKARAQEEEDTVYSVLSGIAQENEALTIDVIDYGDIGVFINSINGKSSGHDNKYWQYWVNNEYGQVSADKYKLEQGDVIMWKFTSSRFKNY